MEKIKYDDYNKFWVSLGIMFIIFPVSMVLFACSDTFDLLITEQEMLTYTETAQAVIAWKQSIPLLFKEKKIWIAAVILMFIGVLMLRIGLVEWHGQQKKDDKLKDLEIKKLEKEIDMITSTMSDEQVIQNMINKNDSLDLGAKTSKVLKNMLIELADIKI